MTPKERVDARLKGEHVDRIPNLNIVMQFAASYIGATYRRFYTDYQCLVAANLRCCEDFGIDMLSAISDPMREAAGMGAMLTMPEDGVPYASEPPLKFSKNLGNLRIADPMQAERMKDRISAVECYHREGGSHWPILGWVEGPLAEACDLRSIDLMMIDLFEDPAFVSDLLEMCLNQAEMFARAQIEAGADYIGIGDAAASLVGPELYRQVVLNYEQRLIESVHRAGARAKLHICGDVTPILDLLPETGADIIDVDWMVDFGSASAAFGSQTAACGNFDPVSVLLQGTPENIRAGVNECIASGNDRCFIAAGCEVPKHTPYENMRAVAEALLDYGAV